MSFYARDYEAAIKWYSDLLGIEPYFNIPGYAEFRIGDYQHELGIIDSKYAPKDYSPNPSGAIVFWHVTLIILKSYLHSKNENGITENGY